MNDDHDPIDALLRSGGQVYPPAATPDAAHLRSVVTTSRRRGRRTRGTVLAGAAALVAGGALLTVRPSEDEQADTTGVPAADTTTQPPTTAVDQLYPYPAELLSAYCETVPTIDGAWGEDSHVVLFWIEGAVRGESSVISLSVDGQPLFEGEMGLDGSASLETDAPLPTGTTPLPEDVPPSPPQGEWIVGLVESTQDSAYFLVGGSEDPPQVIAIDSELFGTIEVNPTGGTIFMVKSDGSTNEFPIAAIAKACDDIEVPDPAQPNVPIDPETGLPSVAGSEDGVAPTTMPTVDPASETVPPTTDPVPSTTAPADPITTTSIAPLSVAPTTDPTPQLPYPTQTTSTIAPIEHQD